MRVRITFTKHGKVRFTSHRDLARVWERAIRRLELPVAYSQGFSPRPKVHFGLALPTGAESDFELLDVDLDDERAVVALDGLPERFDRVLPVGISVLGVDEVPLGTMSLQEAVTSATWSVVVGGGTVDELEAAVARITAADELMMTRQRKGRDVTDDIAPYLIEVRVVGPVTGGIELAAELGTRPRGLRPSELVAALGDPFSEVRITRTHQWMQQDGARQELPGTATSAPHATRRAS